MAVGALLDGVEMEVVPGVLGGGAVSCVIAAEGEDGFCVLSVGCW